MRDTIQVIRVNPVDHDASLGTTVTFFDDNDQRWAIVGDVIELTEERHDGYFAMAEPDGSHKYAQLARLVETQWRTLEWEATDA